MTLRRYVFHRRPFTSGLIVAVMFPAVIVYFARGVIA